MRIPGTLHFLSIFLWLCQVAPAAPPPGYVLAWSDEFDGDTLDTAKWDYRTDSRHWSTQLPANVRVGNGLLYLDLKKENAGGMAYTGGGVISKAAMRYGYYEARMKTPPGAGWHTSFWMMRYAGTGGTDPAAAAIELDAIENDSISPLKYGVNTHRWNPTPHATFGTKTINTPSLNAGFHVVGCEFTPTAIRYFFGGAVVQTVDATQFAHGDLNVWLTSIASYLGGTTAVDDTQLPATAQFDYARFYVPVVLPAVAITSPGANPVTISDAATALRLTAAISSGGNGTPVTTWSALSGPGAVTFLNASAADTAAQFSAVGVYVLRCAASDAAGTGSATVTVTVGGGAQGVVSLREGVNGYTHGATIIRADHTDWNAGARDQLIVGRNSAQLRTVFSFDLSAIPAGAAITRATLDLWTATAAGSGTVGALGLRALTATPVEGTGIGDGVSTNNGTGTGATWLSRTGASAWTNPGGDFAAAVLTSLPGFDATLTDTLRSLPSSAAFVASVQAAVNAAQPLNLVLSAANEASGGAAFTRLASDDAATLARRPLLTIEFGGNAAPVVNPGAAQLVVAAFPATLAGSVSGASSALWSLVSGPGAASFSDASNPAASVTFTQPGSYVLRLSAVNSSAQTWRDLAVNVGVPGPLNLTASAPTASEVLLNWTDATSSEAGFVIERMTVGSGVWTTVLTTAPNVTSIRDFSAAPAGSYVYRIRAVNTDGSSSASALSAGIAVPAMGPLSPLIDAWRMANFGTVTAAGLASDTADPDGDGLRNLAEYALGTNPVSPTTSAAALPCRIVNDLGSDYLGITFQRRRNADIRYLVEVSSDLATWSTATVQVGVPLPATDPDLEQITVRDSVPRASTGQRFMRLRILRF